MKSETRVSDPPSVGSLVCRDRSGEVGEVLSFVEPKPGWNRALVRWPDGWEQYVDLAKLRAAPAGSEAPARHDAGMAQVYGKRSEAAAAAKARAAQPAVPAAAGPTAEERDRAAATFCGVCRERQFQAPDGSGVTCPNGHGGADAWAPGRTRAAADAPVLPPRKADAPIVDAMAAESDALFASALEELRGAPPMTPAQREEQRRDFAAGNVGLSNPAVTRAVVDKVADEMAAKLYDDLTKLGFRFGSLSEIREWTPLKASVARSWLDQGAVDKDQPVWLDEHRPGKPKFEEKWTPPKDLGKPEKAKGGKTTRIEVSTTAEGAKKLQDLKSVAGLPVAKVEPAPKASVAPPPANGAPAATIKARPPSAAELPGAWQDPPRVADPPLFARADGSDELSPQMERLVTTVFDVSDIDEEARELESMLTMGETRSDYGTVLAALDRAEDNARRAHRLFVNAQLEQKRFLLEREEVDAALYKAGVESLKESGDKVTVEAVKARYVLLYGDEWKAGEEKRARVKLAVEHMEQLAFFWSSRCRTLQVILSTLRK